MAHGTTSVIFKALFANLGIAVAKLAGFAFSGSASLLAESVHSLVDCSNQILLLVGSKLAAKPANETHPLGYGREAFFWGFMVAILLFSLGGLFAIYEGAHKLSHPEPLNHPIVGVAILVVAILLEGYSFMAALAEIRAQNTFGSLWAWFRKTTASDLLVIFTEDLAALIGLFIALGGLSVAWATGEPLWDAAGSICVGVLLVAVAVLLAAEIKSLIVGEAPDRSYRERMQTLLEEEMPGAKLLRLLALQTGAHEVMLACKISPPPGELGDFIARLNRFEKKMKAEFPEVRWQFMEPDLED